MTKTLKQKTLRSGVWVIFGHLFSQVLRLGGNLILTRLLVPEMFGVMAIITVMMSGLAMFSDVGLLQNIVQSKRGEDPDYLNTAWTIQIIRGFLIFLLALLLSGSLYLAGQAGYLSTNTVYGNAQLPIILVVASASAIISGFNSIHLRVLNRKLMMNKLIIIDLSSQMIGLVFMVAWAWFQRDIWALVFGGIISSFLKMLLSHIVMTAENCKFKWDKTAVNEIIHFGKWIFLSSILGFLLNQGDKLLLGGFVNSETLGIYTIAFFLANALKAILSKLMSSVFFPVLSETYRNNSNEVPKIYYIIRSKIDKLSMLTAGFLFSSGNVIVGMLYDDRYVQAGWMLQILSITLIGVGYMLASQCFLAAGKPRLETQQVVIQLISLYAFLPIGFYLYGIEGAVWVIAIASLLRVITSLYQMKKHLFIRYRSEFSGLVFIPIGWVIGEIFKVVIDNICKYFDFS